MKLTILARAGEYDVELEFEITHADKVAMIFSELAEVAPEIKPRPRFQGNGPKVELPFEGLIEKTEKVPAKDGKKEYNLAHVKSPDGSLVPVKFWGPLRSWPVGMTVNVIKGQYGPMLEDKEGNDDIPF